MASKQDIALGGLKRLYEIDALRGLAALQVVLYHYTSAYGAEFGWPGHAPLINMHAPQAGVAVFFVISGFVISMTLERSRTVGDFAVSRFARLFPPFWTCCLLTTALICATGFNPFKLNWPGFLTTLTMANGLTTLPFIDPSYWTLTRELLFYVMLSTVYFGIGKRHVNMSMLVWVIFAALYNILLADNHAYSCSTLRSCGALLSNSMFAYLFAGGVMIYRLYAGDRSIVVYATLLLAVLSSSVSEWPTHHLQSLFIAKSVFYFSLLSAAAFGLLPLLRSRVLVFLGAISYSLYLTHQVIGAYVIQQLLNMGINVNLAIAVTIGLVVLLSTAVCLGIERPAQRRLRNWFKARQARTRLLPSDQASHDRPPDEWRVANEASGLR
jgi:peptidoglycan/LPS O-acetylase OafA/YrhL